MKTSPQKSAYMKKYYAENRERILSKAKKKYFKTKKKTPKCKICGKKLSKKLDGKTKYCDACLNSKGHGIDAHRMASVRWQRKIRKKHLTK